MKKEGAKYVEIVEVHDSNDSWIDSMSRAARLHVKARIGFDK